MIEAFLFVSALAGTSYAAWTDLKTTEVSDLVSILMASLGIGASFFYSFFTGEWSFFINCMIVGTSFLAFGSLLYFAGMWGGADALILGSTGYLVHSIPNFFSPALSDIWPYPVSFLFNLFLVGALYSMFYSVYIAFKHGLFSDFFQEVSDQRKRIILLGVVYISVSLLIPLLSSRFYNITISFQNVLLRSFLSFLAVEGLLLLYIFFSTVQNNFMEERISVDDLEPGEVISENPEFIEEEEETPQGILSRICNLFPSRIKGLSEEEVRKIRDKRDHVIIRRGVTFVVAFPVTILLTYIFGDILYNLFLLVF